ncbi:hypothetical protein [Effusibacillus consociatus]|uniref:Uncharacterized protein n=1 Tax=Effusibacillus consociatus TaxID=1117041 RepID=A0ABV9Q4F1_9BACL
MIFDHPFYALLPAPPLGILDPCFPQWARTNRLAAERASVCRLYGNNSAECVAARERYFEAARQYAFCLDDTWGQNEF